MSKTEKLKQKSEIVLARINKQTGIDFDKYSEITELIVKIKNMVLIQNYVIRSIYKPIIISLIIYVSMFFILDMNVIEKIIYGIIGFILFFFNGLFYGLLKCFSQIKNDLKSLIDMSINVTEKIFKDFTLINENNKDIKNPISLIFEGVIAAAVTPTLISILTRIPFIGGLLINFSDKSLNFTVNQLKKYENKINVKTFVDNEKLKGNKLHLVMNNYLVERNNSIDQNFSRLKIPIKVIFVILLLLTLFLLLAVK